MYAYFIDKINSNKNFLTIFLIFSIIFFTASMGYVIKKSNQITGEKVLGVIDKPNQQKYYKYNSQKFVSRGIMIYAQDIIRQETATLPQIARFYAYVSTTFFHIYEINNDLPAAIYGVTKVINTLYPKYINTTDEAMLFISKNKIVTEMNLAENTKLDSILHWIKNDGFEVKLTDDKINKPGWENISTGALESPMAGSWKHWILPDNDTNLQFTDRPAEEINQYEEEIKELKRTIKNLTPSQRNTALFWLNNKGKEGVVGIWQNRLYDEVDKSKVDELQFSKMQKNLAISLADVTIEIWKIKYTNWSTRLQYTNPEVISLIPQPLSPRFVGEYAAIGSAASDILGFYLPDQKDIFIKDSNDARDSGKWGGILLESDNQSGYTLGKNIANQIIKKLT
jgi:hypothetical protein